MTNQSQCPRCKAKAEADHTNRKKMAEDTYGRVSIEEWERLKKGAESGPKPCLLQEDVSVGITPDGRFVVNYRGTCSVCGFSCEFGHETNLDPNTPNPDPPIPPESRRTTKTATKVKLRVIRHSTDPQWMVDTFTFEVPANATEIIVNASTQNENDTSVSIEVGGKFVRPKLLMREGGVLIG